MLMITDDSDLRSQRAPISDTCSASPKADGLLPSATASGRFAPQVRFQRTIHPIAEPAPRRWRDRQDAGHRPGERLPRAGGDLTSPTVILNRVSGFLAPGSQASRLRSRDSHTSRKPTSLKRYQSANDEFNSLNRTLNANLMVIATLQFYVVLAEAAVSDVG
jgi:hypothetical protein